MPSKSPAQKRTMAAAAHNARFAKKVGIPQRVAKDFNRADAAARDPDAAEDVRLMQQGKPDTADADAPLDVRLLKQALAADALRKRGR